MMIDSFSPSTLAEEADAIVIGAGMSGLALAIRLSMAQKKVILLESHSVIGGLNSYYQRGPRKLDVGLHALTNFATPKSQHLLKTHPLLQVMKQLRIPYADFKLCPQIKSRIQFANERLYFSNDIELLISEIKLHFPNEIDGFKGVMDAVLAFDELNLNQSQFQSAKQVLRTYLKSQRLIEMLMCPLLIYGSATPNDMDFYQFCIMFKSIFLEGFGRPEGGVRTILDLLMARFNETCSDSESRLILKSKVIGIEKTEQRLKIVRTADGKCYTAPAIYSSIGFFETDKIITDGKSITESSEISERVGKMSFSESIFYTDAPTPPALDTIIFYNQNENIYHYRPPVDGNNRLSQIDNSSAVICLPHNFKNQSPFLLDEKIFRVTQISNPKYFIELRKNDKNLYQLEKNEIKKSALKLLEEAGVFNLDTKISYHDVFTPASIERYTGHINGAVYGAENKIKNGKTKIPGLHIIGTDQGFLGITGSLLSGITIANQSLMENL